MPTWGSAKEFRYAVLGAGRQGVAAAYDLARFGDADRVTLADVDPRAAERGAARVNGLLQREVAVGRALDARDGAALTNLLRGHDAALSALPYFMNVEVTRAAIAARVHLADLGGNTAVVQAQREQDAEAREATVSVVPDCGLAPGMGNTLAVYGLERTEGCERIEVRCGGLPQQRVGPLDYKMVFSLEGLTNEYTGTALALRGGELVTLPALTEPEELDLPQPLGRCEAFVTTGGTSTCPYSLRGRVRDYDYKTVRYPGHLARIRLLNDLGLFDQEPIEVGGTRVRPRDVFHALAGPRLRFDQVRDLVVLRIRAHGRREGRPVIHEQLVLDYHDEITGFTAMERCTAFPAAIVVSMLAHGECAAGVLPLETAIEAERFVAQLKMRGIPWREGFLDPSGPKPFTSAGA